MPPGERVAFVTVDPDRDSPEVLRKYVRAFDAGFRGLTGSPEALAPVYAAYGVSPKKLPPERPGEGYAMEHGTALYFIRRDGTLGGLANWDDPPAAIAQHMQRLQ